MAFIDSSVGSPLARASTMPPAIDEPDILGEPDEVDAPEAEAPQSDIVQNLIDQIDDVNLARRFPDDVLNTLGQVVVREFDIDENSRADWKDKAEKALNFATQEAQPKQFPWPNASNVIFPLITQAALQFGARTYAEVIQSKSVVKGVVWGSDDGLPVTDDGTPKGKALIGPDGQPVWLSKPGEKRERAERIGEHMSWQLLEEMPEWEPQTDQLLHQIPIIGGAGRKTYRDPVESRNKSLFVSLMNLVWNYHAPSFEAAPRHSERLMLYPNEIIEYERTDEDEDGKGMFLHLDYGPGGGEQGLDGETTGDAGDPDAPHFFIEQHRRYDLDEDGYAEPYIVTVHQRSAKVVRIVARYDEEGIETNKDGDIRRIAPVEHYTLIPFLPNIDGGSYPMGFGHLLKLLNEAINTALNQMFDAGTLENAGGGFMSDQLGVPSGPVNFQVGKYVRVTTKGQAIRDAVFPLPFKGPSTVLFQLLGVLMASGKEVAGIQDILAGDAQIANAPPTTVLALIEQGLKGYTSILKRVFRGFKSEFGKLYRLNRIYLTENQRYRIGDEWREITPEDYRLGGGVEPVADPSMVTDMQRLGRAQILIGFKDDPQINQIEIKRRLFTACGIDRIDELFAPPNPVAEQAAQLEMAMKTAELGRVRAGELKDQTQAFLNLALARAKASAQEETFIASQLDFLRLHIEALNTQVKAAEVEGKHRIGMESVKADARRAASDAVPGNAGAGVPAMAPQPDNGGLSQFPVGPGPELPGGGGGPAGNGAAGPVLT